MHRSNLDYSDLALEKNSMRKLEGNFAAAGPGVALHRAGHPVLRLRAQPVGRGARGHQRARAAMIPDNKVEGRLCVAVMHQQTLWQLGRSREADAVLGELDDLVEREAPFFLPNLKAHRAKLALFDADKRVARVADEFFVTEVDRVELYRVSQHFTTARAHLALGHGAEALRVLDLLDRFGREFNRPLDVGEAGALKASLLWAYGKKAEACEALSAALEALAPCRVRAHRGRRGRFGGTSAQAAAQAGVGAGIRRALERAYVHDLLLAAHATAQRHAGVTANIAPKPVKLSRQQARAHAACAGPSQRRDRGGDGSVAVHGEEPHEAAYRKLDVHNAMDAVTPC